jgi:hypothetical protein
MTDLRVPSPRASFPALPPSSAGLSPARRAWCRRNLRGFAEYEDAVAAADRNAERSRRIAAGQFVPSDLREEADQIDLPFAAGERSLRQMSSLG